MMARIIPKLSRKRVRELPWGIGDIRERGGKYQARWYDGESRKSKTFLLYEEAEDWLRAVARLRPNPITPEERRAAYDGTIVYFVQPVDGGLIKIGHAA